MERSKKMGQALAMYQAGRKLADIAARLGLPAGTVRRWKCVHRWAEKGGAAPMQSEGNRPDPLEGDISALADAPALTDKQCLFALYYAKSHNAAQSYQRVYGCSRTSALVRGPVLAGKAEVRGAISRASQALLSRTLLEPGDIVQKYIEIAFADITDFVEFDRGVVTLRPADEIDGSLLSELNFGRNGIKVKLEERTRALQWLGGHMGLLTEEQRAQIEKQRAETEAISKGFQAEEALEDDPITIALKDVFDLLHREAQRPDNASAENSSEGNDEPPAASCCSRSDVVREDQVSSAACRVERGGSPADHRQSCPSWRTVRRWQLRTWILRKDCSIQCLGKEFLPCRIQAIASERRKGGMIVNITAKSNPCESFIVSSKVISRTQPF